MLIGFDPATKEGDYSCMICGEIDEEGNWHVKKVKCYKYKPKEVKKVRPYLEVKVVKAKKQKSKVIKIDGEKYVAIRDDNGKLLFYKHQKPKGTWVNGENLDKIKFPCFCRYNYEGGKYYGEINTKYNEHKEELEYELSDITQQVDGRTMGYRYSVRYTSFSLKDLIKVHDIHILKGKIILFEEE